MQFSCNISDTTLTPSIIGELRIVEGLSKDSFLSRLEQSKLKNLLGIAKVRHLYRASEDGFQASVFHQKCDNIPNTLTVIKSQNGFVFGGFTTKTWDGRWFKKDDDAFLFSLINEENKPEKFNVDFCESAYAICCAANFGPVFGAAHTICIYDDSNQNSFNFTHLGENNTYVTKGKSDDYLAGSRNFVVKDIEVYQVEEF